MYVDYPGLGHNIAGYFNLLHLSRKMTEWLVQRYKHCRLVRIHYRMEPYRKKYKKMMPCFIIFGSTAANQVHFGWNIWGLTTVKLINVHTENSKMWWLRLETTKIFIHIAFQVQINCFSWFVWPFHSRLFFFDKIAEGPDSFCHHCTSMILRRTWTVQSWNLQMIQKLWK